MNTDFTALRYEPAVQAPPGGDRILIAKQFYEDTIVGSFFSCIYRGALRVHIVFDEDTEDYIASIAGLLDRTLKEVNLPGKIWTGNGNHKIMAFLKSRYSVFSDAQVFHYESSEYRMAKGKFHPAALPGDLEARTYEEQHTDAYLQLLNDAMRFFIPPHDFVAKKQEHCEDFRRLQSSGAFQAFWEKGMLAGLYWLEGNEVDTIAVSPHLQRRGYGHALLTQAIQRVFETTDADFAVLYCVGWNSAAQAFYQKFGMELHTMHLVRYTAEE